MAAEQLDQKLLRWVEAGAIDQHAAERIRALEAESKPAGTGRAAVLAIALGALMVAAGVLLFVAAHWEDLSHPEQFLVVLVTIVGFHVAAAALMTRMRALGVALHAAGTVALGGGIYLAGQIFNLQEDWPGGVLLWAIGALLFWLLLRDWPQATLVALLIPAWIASEWAVRIERLTRGERPMIEFLTLLAFTYFGAGTAANQSSVRRALAWVGGITLLPLAAMLAASDGLTPPLPGSWDTVCYAMALALPLLTAWFLRRSAAVWNVGFALWVLIVGQLNNQHLSGQLALYAGYALGSIGLVFWGLQERRSERINLGVAGFAITVVAFYFSTVLDRLGRSEALICFGVLFLSGGWMLEQLRRKLVAHTAGGTA